MRKEVALALVFLLGLVALPFGCGRQPKPLIVDMHKLKLSDFAMDGCKFDSSVGEIMKRLGQPTEVIIDRPDSQYLQFGSFFVGADDKAITSLSGTRLRLGTFGVPPGMNIVDFCEPTA